MRLCVSSQNKFYKMRIICYKLFRQASYAQKVNELLITDSTF